MKRKGAKRRLLSSLSARDIDDMRRWSDEARLERFLAEQELREPHELVDPDEAARAARVLWERRDG